MNILLRKPHYTDGKIEEIAQKALLADPLTADPAAFTITSRRGVIHIEGTVHRGDEGKHVEAVIVSALQHMGVKYDYVVNDLRVTSLPSSQPS